MRKKLLSMFLALSMVLTMLPATALAVTTTLSVGDDQTYPWTPDGLKNAMAASNTGDTVMLMGGTAGTLSFSNLIALSSKSITLDLNGQTMEYTGPFGGCGIAVNSASVLTVTDSSYGKTGSFTVKEPGATAFNVNDKAALIICGGTVGNINMNFTSSLTVSGGKVKANGSAILVNSPTANVSITGGDIESTGGNALNIFPMGGNPGDKANVSIMGGTLSAPGTSNQVIYINPGSSNGNTEITIGTSAVVTATGTNGVALKIYSQKNTTLKIESGAKITGGFGEIRTPDVSPTASKEASKQKTINFTLKNPETYKNPNWKLYTANTGTTEVSGVSVASVGSTLTLTAAGEDLSAGSYYLAVAADPTQYYAESARTKLTVNSYVPPPMTGAATISGTPQVGQTLTLTNETSGGGTPVWYATNNNTAIGGTEFAGGVLTAAQAGKYIYVTVPSDASHTGSVKSNVLGPVEKKTAPAAPSVSFSFDGTDANKLEGATTLMEYSLDGGTNWENCTADKDLTTSLGNITVANDIKVRVKETEDTKAGEIATIDILAGSPIAEGTITATGCTTEADNDGTLIGVTAGMEYQKLGASDWTAGIGSNITGLSSGAYLVRNKATGNTMAGAATTVIVGAFIPKAEGPAAPSVTFSFDGTSANKLLGATALMEYSLDGGTNWENCTADMDLTTSLGSITVANDIKVRVKETDTHEAGAVQNIDITQPSAPTIGKTDETLALNDGTITGVSSLMEYRKSGDTSYTPISGSTVTGLVPGEYLVRFKATGTVLASPDTTVEIVAFTKKTPTLADLTYSLAAVDYDGSAKPLTVTKKTAGIGDITVYYGGSTTVPINAGTYAITVDIAGNAEYNTAAGLSLGSYTINKIDYAGTTALPASVLVSGQAGATITLPTLPTGASYGTPTASGTITMTNMSIAGTTLTYTAPASTAGQTGTMTIPVTGAANYNNYNIVVTVTYTAKTPQVISFANSNLTKTYGDAKFTNQLTQTTVNGTITYVSDDVSVATVNTATGEVTILAVGDGSATITATAAETATHAQATASYTVTVAKKSLTLKADDKSITKGDGLPAFTYTVTGLVDGDAVTTAPTMSTAADGTAAGTFDITITGGVVANAASYSITHTKGTLTVAELLFTATVTNGTGGGSYAEGATVTITANDRSGYTFTGWSCVDVTFANATAKTTTFTMPAKAVTVTANYRKNSSGGGGYVPSPAPIEIKVPGTVDITDKTVTDAFEKALAEAKKNGNEQKGITVVLRVDTGSKTDSNVKINLPKTVQDIIITKKIVNTIVVVDNPDIRIGMDLTTIKEINRQANSDVNITATLRDSSKLTGDGAKAIGSRPVFDLKVNYGSGKQVQSFGAGSVSVNIPYTLGTNEKAGNVQAVYVDDNGKVHWLVSSVYDSVEKVLRFSTSHFSTYGVGYKEDAPSFTDIANHYRKDDIEFVTTRGLLEGTGTTTFEPNRAITRGMLVTALGRMANADVDVYTKSSFTDVKNDAYYMGYIEWANKMGILSGIDGKFSPDMAVSREHMAVILDSYAKAMGITLEKVYEEGSFADKSKISDYAKEAVKEMQVAGIIINRSNNLFDPAGTATRSEVSGVLRRFIESTTGSSIPQDWIMNDSGKWMYYENGKAVTGKKEISGLIYEFNQYGETASSPGKPIENTDKEQKEEKKEETPKNPSTPSPVIYNTYTVKKGDSFWKISQKYKCSMYELAKINNKTIKDIIYPGEVLKIPKK